MNDGCTSSYIDFDKTSVMISTKVFGKPTLKI